jgi:hypothetical protein
LSNTMPSFVSHPHQECRGVIPIKRPATQAHEFVPA